MADNQEEFDTSNLTGMIESLLSNPQTGSKIQELIGSFGGNGEKENNMPAAPSGTGMPDIEKLMKFKTVYDNAMKKSDPRITLLTALRPYLSESRNKNLDVAIKILNLSKLSSIMKETDLLKEFL